MQKFILDIHERSYPVIRSTVGGKIKLIYLTVTPGFLCPRHLNQRYRKNCFYICMHANLYIHTVGYGNMSMSV